MKDINKEKLKQFVYGELFDLILYQKLLKIEKDAALKEVLSELIVIEKNHLQFWQKITGVSQPELSISLKIRLNVFLSLRKIFGPSATVLILEMIEIYGVRKYFSAWQEYKGTPLRENLRRILEDEFEHEDKAIGERIGRKINIDKIRSAILGFNDGFVEIFGAMSGFLAAFANFFLVGFAGFIVGLAGSISMGASTFLSAKSAVDFEEMEERKKEIVEKTYLRKTEKQNGPQREKPLSQAFYVAIFYFIGALLPVLPFLLGAQSVILPILIGFFLVLILSFFTAFFAGESFLKRLKLNSIVIVGAIFLGYFISYLAKTILGVEI